MNAKERASKLINSFCPHAGTGSTRLASNCLLCVESAIEDAEQEATERERERCALICDARYARGMEEASMLESQRDLQLAQLCQDRGMVALELSIAIRGEKKECQVK